MASFPKSGRTWMRFFFAYYINNIYGLGKNIDWKNFACLSPSYLCNAHDGLLTYPQGIERIIVSHNKPIGKYFKNRKVFYITRNFLDILVSYYFFHKSRERSELNDISIDNFCLDHFAWNMAMDRINYFSRMLEHSKARFIVPYEILLEQSDALMHEIIRFSPFPYVKEAVDEAIAFSRFDNMRNLEVKTTSAKDDKELHTRSAKKYRYSDFLTPHTQDLVRERLDRELRGLLKEYYLIDANNEHTFSARLMPEK